MRLMTVIPDLIKLSSGAIKLVERKIYNSV